MAIFAVIRTSAVSAESETDSSDTTTQSSFQIEGKIAPPDPKPKDWYWSTRIYLDGGKRMAFLKVIFADELRRKKKVSKKVFYHTGGQFFRYFWFTIWLISIGSVQSWLLLRASKGWCQFQRKSQSPQSEQCSAVSGQPIAISIKTQKSRPLQVLSAKRRMENQWHAYEPDDNHDGFATTLDHCATKNDEWSRDETRNGTNATANECQQSSTFLF